MFSAVEINEEKFSQMLNPTLKFGENTKTIGQTYSNLQSEYKTIGWDK
jgi:hypothetical protein